MLAGLCASDQVRATLGSDPPPQGGEHWRVVDSRQDCGRRSDRDDASSPASGPDVDARRWEAISERAAQETTLRDKPSVYPDGTKYQGA